MNNVDKQYLELVKHILNNGVKKVDRTGTGTLSVFDYNMRFNMSEGFPLLTSKKTYTKGVIHELIWFLKGDTTMKYLLENDTHIWDGDAYKAYLKECDNSGITAVDKSKFIEMTKINNWSLGPIYGYQWRNWGGRTETYQEQHTYGGSFGGPTHVAYGDTHEYEIKGVDQIADLIHDLKNNPDSRRLIVSAWNVGDLPKMTLPPCHFAFQCYTQELNISERKKHWCDSIGKSIHYAEDLSDVELDTLKVPKRKLSLKWMQRSVDVPLGLPFNIASYGFLLHILAREVNMVPHELIFSGGDCHIYLNQVEGIKQQLTNETFELSKLVLTNKSIDDIKYEDFTIENYKSAGVVKMPLSN